MKRFAGQEIKLEKVVMVLVMADEDKSDGSVAQTTAKPAAAAGTASSADSTIPRGSTISYPNYPVSKNYPPFPKYLPIGIYSRLKILMPH